MDRGKEKGGMDYVRMAAACMVVAIHTYPFISINETLEFIMTHILCRTAVPYFFMVTGYFVLPKAVENEGYFKEYLKKTGWIYAVSTLLYLPVNLYSGKLNSETSFLEVLKSLFVLTGKVRFNPDDCGLPLCQEAERISRNNQGSHKDGYRNAQAGRMVWAFGRNQGNDGIFPPGHTGNLYPSVCQ